MCSEQINQPHSIGEVVGFKLQDTPIGCNGVIYATVGHIGIDQDGVFCDGLIDFTLADIDLAQDLVNINVLRGQVNDTQTFLGSRRHQAMIDIALNILHGLHNLQADIFR